MNDEISGPEIQPADRRLRRVAMVLLPAMLVAALVGLSWLRRRMLDLEYTALTSPSEAAQGVMMLSSRVFVGAALVLGVFGSWYFAVAWKTLRSERFPPEGVPVLRDTPIRSGAAARLRGFVGLFLALLMLLTALALPTLGPQALYDVFLPAFERAE